MLSYRPRDQLSKYNCAIKENNTNQHRGRQLLLLPGLKNAASYPRIGTISGKQHE
jgi:hypothetical protein